MNTTLGDRIKFFRKQRNLSQFDLELETGLSLGVISRIENNKVSPTKESIHKISTALKLNKHQLADLFEVAGNPVSEEEINEARLTVKKHYANPETLSHLMDDRWNLIEFSPGFVKLLKFNSFEIEKMVGQNIMTLIFDPDSPYHQRMDQDNFGDFAKYVLSRKKYDIGETPETWIKELIKKLSKFETFKTNWKIVRKEPLEHYSNDSRTIYFNVEGEKIKCLYGREPLKTCPRFYVVEYSILT